MKNTKLGAILLGALALTMLSGCEFTEDKDDNTPSRTTNTETTISGDADFDAKVASAVEKYIADNQVGFGKQVMDSVNAYQAEQQKTEESAKLEKVKNVPDIREGDHVLGNRDANLVLFEYSDYHCPYCKRFHPTTEKLAKDDNIAIVLRPMPLVHSETATPLHEAAECIADIAGNDAFWSFSKVLFNKSTAINMNNYTDELKTLNIAKIDEIKSCVAEGKFKEKVADSIKEGYALGVNGTPTSILKNMKTGEVRLIGGAYPYDAVKGYITELAK